MDGRKIAVFDSGVGGITMLHRLIDVMPREDYLYYADIANAPYGDKEASDICGLLSHAIGHISRTPLKALVLACHTISPSMLKELQGQYEFPILGMDPVIKPSVSVHDPRKILVAATPMALKNRKFRAFVINLEPDDVLVPMPMFELVNYAEEFDFNSPELRRFVKNSFKRINWDSYHSIVLACTHFMYFRRLIKESVPSHISVLDGLQQTAKHVGQVVDKHNRNKKYTIECSLSGKTVATELIIPYLNLLKREYEHRRYWEYES